MYKWVKRLLVMSHQVQKRNYFSIDISFYFFVTQKLKGKQKRNIEISNNNNNKKHAKYRNFQVLASC